jgi:endo-1,4-beta-xylanase
VALLIAGACSPAKHEPGLTLRQVAAAHHVLIGTAVRATPLRESHTYRTRIARDFNSVTPETQAKWATVEPVRGSPDYHAMDDLVGFAAAHRLRVRGHTLVWGVESALPDWVRAIDDPAALRTVLDDHVASEVHRYAGRVDRWDVVNEPLEKLGATLAANHLLTVLGPDYIARAFRTARAADPHAQLWLNENVFEHLPAKATALVDLVAELVRDGVPVDGVGLQAHFLSGRPPDPGVIEATIHRLRSLGVAVAITELDIPTTTAGLAAQARAYRQTVTEALRAGAGEITVWGVNDGVTWLDGFLGRPHTDPLLFDRHDRPKPAYTAVKISLATPHQPH